MRVVWGTHKGYLDIIYFVILLVMRKYENVMNKIHTSMASKKQLLQQKNGFNKNHREVYDYVEDS